MDGYDFITLLDKFRTDGFYIHLKILGKDDVLVKGKNIALSKYNLFDKLLDICKYGYTRQTIYSAFIFRKNNSDKRVRIYFEEPSYWPDLISFLSHLKFWYKDPWRQERYEGEKEEVKKLKIEGYKGDTKLVNYKFDPLVNPYWVNLEMAKGHISLAKFENQNIAYEYGETIAGEWTDIIDEYVFVPENLCLPKHFTYKKFE